MEFLKGMRKEPIKNIEKQLGFFDKCAFSDEIYVLGHSVAKVDLPYFERIAHDSPKAKWYVSYFNNKETICDNICKIHDINKIEFVTLDDLKQ